MTLTKQATPEIGSGATVGAGSDSYPATVIAVSASGREIVIQHDEHMIVSNGDGMGNGDYVTLPNPNGQVETYTLRKNGRYMLKGVPVSARYGFIGLGERRYYRDPSF